MTANSLSHVSHLTNCQRTGGQRTARLQVPEQISTRRLPSCSQVRWRLPGTKDRRALGLPTVPSRMKTSSLSPYGQTTRRKRSFILLRRALSLPCSFSDSRKTSQAWPHGAPTLTLGPERDVINREQRTRLADAARPSAEPIIAPACSLTKGGCFKFIKF